MNVGLEPPKFEISGNGFLVTIKRPNSVENGSAQEVIESGQKSSQKSSQKIIELITKNNNITTQEIADSLQISRRAVAKHIKKLQEENVIQRVGPDKGGHWEVLIN